ncbi:MAG TPA: alpha/beta hydrolase [Myxococcaceae bacterium]|nr:alpha/beta hydrolase [Myxococcaceae bacterium]
MHTLASLLILAAVSASEKPAIVLVHGAFADASSWSKVIPILQKDGYYVTAVQIPLTSLDDDIAVTKRVIDAQKGPVVVVGHSYGGAVITGAAGGANVKSLVYVDAFAPEAGEPLGSTGDKFPPAPLSKALIPDAAGFLYIDRAKVHDVFAKDLSEGEARIIAVTQKPLNHSVFEAKVTNAAWSSKPSWFIIGTEDRAINPDLLRFYAKRMGAKITEIKGASHVGFLSHPKEVVQVIESAAR